MSKKNRKGVVYSTDSNYEYQHQEESFEDTLSKIEQKLTLHIDRKQRKGKEVILIKGFIGTKEDLNSLGKLLKSKCGVGGSIKHKTILIQGNFRDKIFDILKKEGYVNVKISGS